MKRAVIFAIAGLLLMVSCSKRPNETIKIGGPSNIAMLVLIADERGYFEDAGLDIEYVPLQTGKIAQDALVTGDIDIGVLVEANIAFVRFQGDNDVRVFTSIQEKFDDAIVARRDRSIETPEDLRGRTIGYLPGTTSHVFLSRFLESKGIDEMDVSLLTMPPPAMQEAIIKGDVDAVSVWQPFRYNAITRLGDAAIEFNDPEVYLARAVLAAESDFLSSQSEEVEAILTALIEAEAYIEANLEEAQAFLAQAIGVDQTALRESWNEYVVRVRLDQALVDLIQEEGAWISRTIDEFRDQPVPDYGEAVATAPLNSVAPDRVSIP